jgi:Putative zinc-finger
MKCAEVEKQINSFIDDELSRSSGDKVRLHLEECRACEKTFASLQILSRIVRKEISLPAGSRLDERVMKAFSRQHENKQTKKWQAVIFGQIVVPKPALALAFLTFAIFTGLVFQLGKISATDVRLEMMTTETANLLPSNSEANLPSESGKPFQTQSTDTSPTKFIDARIAKEKIVTRVIYLTKQAGKENIIKARSAKSKPGSFALNSSINENRYLTQVNLSKFQPVAELKTQIIKKDKNYEK